MKKKTLIDPKKLTLADLKKVVGGLNGSFADITTISFSFETCTNLGVQVKSAPSY